jgi:serine-type D-Ala-D-Ala carboxypeptidase (penicillin-binding protein 5/6)
VLACLTALGCLAGLVIAKRDKSPVRPTALSRPTAWPAGTASPAAASATANQPRLGAVSWPADGVSAAGIGGYAVTDGPGATRQVPIASVAKLMTAYVILQDHPLSASGTGPDITVDPSEAAEYPSQAAAGDSLVAVAAGEMITERQALEALLLPSADNMAWILARWDAGSQAAFVARMNAAARSLAMTATSYTDPSGLDPSTISTAADQVRLGTAALRVPALAAITAESTAVAPAAGVVRNTNTLLGQDGIVGLKTGSTAAAGGCLLVAARQEVNGHDTLIVAATFGQPGTAGTILPNALQAGRSLVLALDAALGAGAQPGSRDDSEGPPQRPGGARNHQKPLPAP